MHEVIYISLMKIHKPETIDGFFLQVLKAIEDIEDDNIREYQEKNIKKINT